MGLTLGAVMVGLTMTATDGREAVVAALVAKHGAAQEAAIRRGVDQVAERWWPSDGTPEEMAAFCERHWGAEVFEPLGRVAEQVDGHLHEVRRLLQEPLDLDRGPITPLDELMAEINLGAHVENELYRSKTAFAALLNYPIRGLDEVLEESASWDRRTWAETRMMDRFAVRTPPEVAQRIGTAFSTADSYIAGYYIRMDRLRTADGRQLFPDDLRLITHWNLRDELGAHFGGGAAGLEKQRMILEVMRRIVRQEIPQVVIDNPEVTWEPFSNRVAKVADGSALVAAEREQDVRYAKWLEVFHAVREADRYDPQAPSWMQRRFERDRQIPEAEVKALIESVLGSPEAAALGKVIAQRLGRPLEPFDIWYSGFKSRGTRSEAELDALTRQRYPNVAAFQADLPRILRDLGFAADTASWLADRIVVDPSRGAGHAMGAARREDKAHLRTRIAPGGMDYKGYNIAIHELGHNVEQVFSLNAIDHWWLSGVPNNAFTEALAFTFQARDLELLGLTEGGAEQRARATADDALSRLWSTFEIGGVSLVDMAVWNWLYAHPEATPAELREATLAIARETWNRWYAPIFGMRDSEILAIYSHMIVYGLYLPDYALGHLIAFQVAARLGQGDASDFGKGFELASRQGRLTPDAWMRGATGGPLSAAPLLAGARQALAGHGAGAP